MKILLDECVTKHLKPFLSQYEVYTVREMGWSGIKNGELMSLCTERSIEVLISIDKNLQYQQNLNKYPIIIVIFNSYSSKVEELKKYLPIFNARLSEFKKHTAYILNL